MSLATPQIPAVSLPSHAVHNNQETVAGVTSLMHAPQASQAGTSAPGLATPANNCTGGIPSATTLLIKESSPKGTKRPRTVSSAAADENEVAQAPDDDPVHIDDLMDDTPDGSMEMVTNPNAGLTTPTMSLPVTLPPLPIAPTAAYAARIMYHLP
ncbi:hypothetical protein K443DRAFT_15122 [Laccaria amethystina LaAM-08-1]|uniref:Uncharacterized protein n=1 Tax=Laccaria amethystina LaAM-08-1 TaxID=1095629 RepID=A0A0C9WH45_9AGAR|nr:hypothetical protein K443DRAFT_15122 [Laccaria amethystina LaAM-08-1]